MNSRAGSVVIFRTASASGIRPCSASERNMENVAVVRFDLYILRKFRCGVSLKLGAFDATKLPGPERALHQVFIKRFIKHRAAQARRNISRNSASRGSPRL